MMKKQVLKLIARPHGIKATESGFTLMELMIVVLTIGILAATAISGFDNYWRRSKSAEVHGGLAKLVEGEITYYVKNGNFLEAGPTNIPPSQTKTVVSFATDPNWAILSFGFNDPIYFGYQAVSSSATTIDCEAFGDLDGDGDMSTFRRTVTASGATASAGALYILDELE